MKKFKKIMAVLVAAVMVIATMVPAWAAASTTGAIPGTLGKITIKHTTKDEKYFVYRLFELASYNDTAPDAGSHTDAEAYSYVIDDAAKDAANTTANNWYTWMTTNGYAKTTSNIKNPGAPNDTKQLFWIDENTVTINNISTYHVIVPTTNLPATVANLNANDVTSTNYSFLVYSDSNHLALQSFAKAALTHAVATETTANQVITPIAIRTSSGSDIELDNLLLGYYLVGTTAGTLCSIDTTNNEVDVFDKTDVPVITKQVKARTQSSAGRDGNTRKYTNDATVWVSDTSAEIGDTVYFRTTVTLKEGAKNYVVHDVMEKGFTKDVTVDAQDKHSTISLYYFGNDNDKTFKKVLVEGTDYTVTDTPTSTKCSFAIAFSENFLNGVLDNETVEIEYQAVLNQNAYVYGDDAEDTTGENTAIAILGDGISEKSTTGDTDKKNTNHTVLTYGSTSSTPWASATVQTYQVDIVKTKDSSTTAFETLSGAVFNVLSGSTVKTFVEDTANSNIFRTPLTSETGATDMSSIAGKVIRIRGLAAETYYIREKTAPNGYHKLSNDITLAIAPAGTITLTTSGNVAITNNTTWKAILNGTSYDTNTASQGGIHIINYTTAEMPNTGGMGTTVLYIVGGMLIVLAGAYLFFSRKRMA